MVPPHVALFHSAHSELLSSNRPNFPSWLGKNSSTNKVLRQLQDLKRVMGLDIKADARQFGVDYLPLLRKLLVLPLITKGTEGPPQFHG